MAVTAERVAVPLTAVALNTAGTSALRLIIKALAALSLGPSDVSTTTGLALAAGQTVTVELDAGDVLFAIAGTATSADVLRT